MVTIDNLTVTGSFTKVSDTQLTFVIPSEGRLPAPQDVDVQTYNGVSSTSNGTLTVRENTKDIFGDLDVSGDLSVSGFITGHGITGTSITATTGTFTQRPSVNGSGVALVGEGSASAAGSDGEIQFNDGGSIGADSQLFFDDSLGQLYVSGAGGNVGNVIIASDDNTEGGQVTLSGAKSYSDMYWTVDSYQDKLRIFSGGFPFLQISDRQLQLVNEFNATKVSLNVNGDSFLNGGDVGIGTSSPAAKLHVVGDITGHAISGTSISAPEITNLETATGTLRSDINNNDTDISALQTATGVLSQVSVTGSSSIHAPDLTGVGQVTVTLDGSTVKISGAAGGGGGTPAGSDTQVQFNDGGSFGASSDLTWDDNGLYSNGYISGQDISGQNLFGISGEFGTAARGASASTPSSLVRIHGYDNPKISLYAYNGWSNWEIHGGVNDYLEIKNAGTNPNKYVNLDNLSVGAQSANGESSFYSNTTKPAIYTTCGSSANPDLTGVGQVTVTLDGSTVKISGASAGGGTPAGSDTQVQFNDGGSFGADSSFTWDKTSDKLTIAVSHTDDALLLNSTEASSSASPVLTIKKGASSSPADGDYLGQLKFKGESDTVCLKEYTRKLRRKYLMRAMELRMVLLEYHGARSWLKQDYI